MFSSATPDYELFVLPYMASALIHNYNVRVEVCVEDNARFRKTNALGIEVLLRHYGENRVRIRDVVSSRGVSPNSVRFLETPEVMSEFTYIGDIDILILEQISQKHIDRMLSAGLPYSNVLRPGRRALSGLHFTRSDAYYPVALPAGVDLNLDEALLYALVTSRGAPLPPEEWNRPAHGFHLSLNRSPLPRFVDGKRKPGWSVDRSKKRFLAAYEALQRHPVWRAMYLFFDRRYRVLLGLLDLALADTFPDYRTNRSGQVTELLTDPRLIRSIVTGGGQVSGAGSTHERA